MKKQKKDERLLESIEYIDEKIINSVMAKIEPKNSNTKNKLIRRSKWIGAAVAIAACAVLLALSIPRTTTIVKNFDILQFVGAQGSSGSDEVLLERDGSRGLLYEVNEDGESASFIGFGSCTDDTVYIASTYNGLPVTAMYNYEFEGKGFTPYNQSYLDHIRHIVISDTVKYVDSSCISCCPNIESVYFGASVESITAFSFDTGYGMKFSKVEVSPENPHYSDKGNCIVDLRTNALVLGTYKTVIPDDGSVKIIGVNAFCSANHRLGSIVIPEGVKVIDIGAFFGCYKLERVILPDSLEIIESGAFRDCEKLIKLELGKNLKYVYSNIIVGTELKEVYYKGTVAEWEAVRKYQTTKLNGVAYEIIDGEKKLIYSSKTAPIESFTVICTDGVSHSAAGVTGRYDWTNTREYDKYKKKRTFGRVNWYFGPSGIVSWFTPAKEYEE